MVESLKNDEKIIDAKIHKTPFFMFIKVNNLNREKQKIRARLETIPDIELIKIKYDKKIADLHSCKNRELADAKYEVQAKYPVPQREELKSIKVYN